jgi:hypothetical protein
MTEPTPAMLARLSTDLDSLPKRMRTLPLDRAGRPIPYFVYVDEDGNADHRIVDAAKVRPALKYRWCWVCGHPLGGRVSFAIGPMCVINRVSAEPPQHLDCAIWSATHCPFLVNPNKDRREGGMPDEVRWSPNAIGRNPGAMAVYTTRKFWPFHDGTAVLVRLGDPHGVLWFHYGRDATRDEVLESITSGLPQLRKVAAEEGAPAERALDRMVDDAMGLLPA